MKGEIYGSLYLKNLLEFQLSISRKIIGFEDVYYATVHFLEGQKLRQTPGIFHFIYRLSFVHLLYE